MSAHRFETVGVEHFFELLRRQVVGSGQLDVLDSIAAHCFVRGRDVAQKLRPEAVELQADRAFETWADPGFHGRLRSQCGARGEDRPTRKRKDYLHGPHPTIGAHVLGSP